MHDPSSAECGMLRAIAASVVEEAGRQGAAQAEFHHYRFEALRGPRAGRRRPVPVELEVSFQGQVLEREIIRV